MRSQIRACFDAEEHSFVIALRNVICHEEFPDVGWQMSQDKLRREGLISSFLPRVWGSSLIFPQRHSPLRRVHPKECIFERL